MEEILDITVVIPVHTLINNIALLEKAVQSVKNQQIKVRQIIVVAPSDVAKDLKTINSSDYTVVVNDGATDFCSQINFGASQVDTKYFSILELDDEYSDIYFKNVALYTEAYPEVAGFLPTVVMVNDKNEARQYANEAVWAQGFSEHLGFLDMASLLANDNFIVSGGVFKTEAYNEVGGMKGDIKLYFNYEFLLRFINEDNSTMVIPKLGYKHLTDREGSLFRGYLDPETGIKHDEAMFFKAAAKKEYFFNPTKIPRTIKYSPAVTA